jgi:hypothetical protein
MEQNTGMNPRGLSVEALEKEAEAARKGAHDMWVAGVTIVASFVLVIVLVVLVMIIGHVQLF